MGNVVVWKPSPTQTHSAVLLMRAAGGGRPAQGRHQPGDRRRHGRLRGGPEPPRAGRHPLHRLDQDLPAPVEDGRQQHREVQAPTRGIVGETGGKDFVVAHPTADRAVLKTALTRGSFEFQGQKCSASSRAYVPASIWNDGFKEEFAAEVDGITMGDVTDLSNFIGAVIDERAFAKNKAAIDRAEGRPDLRDRRRRHIRRLGRLLRPPDGHRVHRPGERGLHDRVLRPDPRRSTSTRTTEYDAMLEQMESVSAYALTGCGHRQRPCGGGVHDGEAALRRGQLLHQRQVAPAPSSASSPSAVAAPRAPTTRRAPRRT